MISSCDWFIEFIFLPGVFVVHYVTRTQKRKLVQKKIRPPQKKSLCNRGRGASFLFSFVFWPLCEPIAFIHQWSKYGTMQKFLYFLVFSASLWNHNFLHHFYQINYMFFCPMLAWMTFVPLFNIYSLAPVDP
jgi:hypothetical protein